MSKKDLLELYDNNPRTFTQKLKSKQYTELYAWFLEVSKKINADSVRGKAFIYLFEPDLSCPYGNEKRYSQGKIRFCGKPGKCKCHSDALSASWSAAYASKTEEERKEIWDNRAINWKNNLGVSNPSKLQEVKDKKKETCIEKYGVEYPAQNEKVKEKISQTNTLPEVKDKKKETCIEKYGVEHPMQLSSTKDKLKQSMADKHGVEHYTSALDFAKKSKATKLQRYGNEYFNNYAQARETCLEKYGFEFPAQSSIFKEKRRDECLAKFGVEHPSQRHISEDTLTKLADPLWLQIETKTKSAKMIASELRIGTAFLYKALKKFEISFPARTSVFEQDVINFLLSLKIEIQCHDRTLIKPLELDIYIPSHDIAIECNGSYWHSELAGKNKFYHNNKSEKCKLKKTHLIHIWEHEWFNKPALVKSRIKAKLGLNQRIYARKTAIVEISSNVLSAFLDEHHIQSSCPASIRYGLLSEDVLVAVMSFGKSRYDKKIEFELLRYCSLQGVHIIGGASKLFKHFIRQHYPYSVISYSDRSWNSGGLYEKLGFDYSHSTDPAYYYTNDYINFENRVTFQKHKLKDKLDVFDQNLSEWENMKLNKYNRIWNCGNDVWVYKNT